MKQPLAVVLVCSVLLSPCLAACATHPAPGISGRWKPVNRFASTTQALPLQAAYVFYAAPMDRTLKTMLERWARDSTMPLDYGHPSDFTLYQPVADIRTGDLRQAISAINTLYAANGVVVSVHGNTIMVRPPAPAAPLAAPAAGPVAPGADAIYGTPSATGTRQP